MKSEESFFRARERGEVMGQSGDLQMKLENGNAGFVLEDVPHLTDYIPDLPVRIIYLYTDVFVHIQELIDRVVVYLFTYFSYLFVWQTYPNPLQFNPAYSVVK